MVRFCENTKCKKEFYGRPSRVKAGYARYCSRACKTIAYKPTEETLLKISQKNHQIIGDKRYNWKGDDAVYSTKHKRIYCRYGKADHCEECGSTNRKMYHWSNISGKYKPERSDWRMLCPCCHKQHDVATKLNYEKANEIRRIYSQGNTATRTLSGRYNVSQSMIVGILNNKKYAVA